MKILSIAVLVTLIVIQAGLFQQPETSAEALKIASQTPGNSANQSKLVINEIQRYTQMLNSERQIQYEITLQAAKNALLQERNMLYVTQFGAVDSQNLYSRQNNADRYIEPNPIDAGLIVLSETEEIIDEDSVRSAESEVIGAKAEKKTGSITIARVTAYAPFDNQSGICNDGNPNSTSTGQRPGPSIVAVDPKKIPYGTKLKIKGFNRIFTAGDTGSSLRRYDGIAIDVYFDTYKETRRFGVQYLEIEILN